MTFRATEYGSHTRGTYPATRIVQIPKQLQFAERNGQNIVLHAQFREYYITLQAISVTLSIAETINQTSHVYNAITASDATRSCAFQKGSRPLMSTLHHSREQRHLRPKDL